MKNKRYCDAQIMGILKQAESGVPVSDLCREHGMSSASFYKWRAKFGGMDTSMISEMKAMAEENCRLKRMYAERSMQNDLLKEALGKEQRPSQRNEMAVKAIADRGVRIALACRTFNISESYYRYARKLGDENAEIAEWPPLGHASMPCRSICEADQQPPWPVLFVSAQREGLWLEPQTGLSR